MSRTHREGGNSPGQAEGGAGEAGDPGTWSDLWEAAQGGASFSPCSRGPWRFGVCPRETSFPPASTSPLPFCPSVIYTHLALGPGSCSFQASGLRIAGPSPVLWEQGCLAGFQGCAAGGHRPSPGFPAGARPLVTGPPSIGEHRGLGAGVSKVRSLKMDRKVWTETLIQVGRPLPARRRCPGLPVPRAPSH